MTKQRLSIGLCLAAGLATASAAQAACRADPPEIGDIGPDSELVCRGLEQRFPNAELAVEGRSIHTPTEVTVRVSVDGEERPLRFSLAGFTWHLRQAEGDAAGVHTAAVTSE
ncbi:MAG: hypothetical protein LJE60_12170 [Thiocapsa sp.]|jgi:hypothetical protein|nr:hypothetical protein [Thiocapsa sp.]MCG6897845.1 hypothetical protein [Thiocapsa sp.]